MKATELVLAIDAGGTRLKGALVDTKGQVVHDQTHPTPRQDGPDAVVEAIAELATNLAGQAPVAAAGLVVPGIIDEETGIAVLAANLGWRDLPMRARLESRLRLPLAFGHDVRAGGLAEVRMGAARGARNALFMPVGTGIAAAIVVDGRLVSSGGFAGESGHLVIDPEGRKCPCGQRGCLETIGSAAAVARRYGERTGSDADAAAVASAAEDGDPVARQVWAEAVEALATALVTCTTLLGPEVIVLGGGLAESGELLLTPLRAALDDRLTFQRKPRVVKAELGDRAGVLGAALLARDLVK